MMCHLKLYENFVSRLKFLETFFKIVSICLSICLFVAADIFLELDHQFFQSFGMVWETHVKLCVRKPGFWKNIAFAPKMRKIGQKQGFLNLVKNLVINFFLNLVYNENLSLLFSCKISYLEKTWFLSYGPTFSWSIRQQDFLIIQISRTN